MIDYDYSKENVPMTPGERVFYFIFILGVLALFTAEVFMNFEPVKLSILFYILAWWPLIFLHELGHSIAAKMVGWQVAEFVIGYGRIVRAFKYNDTSVELRLLPVGGYMLPKPNAQNWSRFKSAFVYFAGPGIEIALFFFLWWILGYGNLMAKSENYITIAMQSVAFCAITGALFNLMPMDSNTNGGRVPNDGMGILLAILGARPKFEEEE